MWTTESIKAGLDTSDGWVCRAIQALCDRQTEDERASAETFHHNGMGFNACDARFLTSLAEQLDRGAGLSPKQMAAARRAVRKYAGQLAAIANAKAA
jgi:hypothetical protein